MLKKDTRFVDLPQNIKQKLINIHRLSNQVYISSDKLPIPSFTDLYTQIVNLQTSSLERNLNKLNNNFNILTNIPSKVDFGYVETQLRNDIERLKEDVKMYKEMDNKVDFCGCIETTYKILNKRYEDNKHL
ncbi:uncharacterized protein VNE69_04118 [Vairimorpha necatrix]|uniref:Uncharacterized protein n=1 Tax=Vairimorpha necatrix TaxID=6039 RepID=A0AAX4JBM1_9MICR